MKREAENFFLSGEESPGIQYQIFSLRGEKPRNVKVATVSKLKTET